MGDYFTNESCAEICQLFVGLNTGQCVKEDMITSVSCLLSFLNDKATSSGLGCGGPGNYYLINKYDTIRSNATGVRREGK